MTEVVPERPPRKRRPFLVKFLLILAAAYVGGIMLLYTCQRFLIFPGASLPVRGVYVNAQEDVELIPLKTDAGVTIHAMFARAMRSAGETDAEYVRRPTIVFCYGNGMNLRSFAHSNIPTRLRMQGLNVMCADYEGYGPSDVKPSAEGMLRSVRAALEHLKSRTDIDPDRLVLLGHSLGGFPALHFAASGNVARVVTIATFTDMAEVANFRYPFLPEFLLRGLLDHPFDNRASARRLALPWLIIHGVKDEIVAHAMAAHLEAAAAQPVERFDIDGARHNDIFERGGTPLYRRIALFAHQTPSPPR